MKNVDQEVPGTILLEIQNRLSLYMMSNSLNPSNSLVTRYYLFISIIFYYNIYDKIHFY